MIALRLALKNMARKPERSLLTGLGVLLAVAATVSLLSISEGLSLRMLQETNNQNVDLYVTSRNRIPLPLVGIPFSSAQVPPFLEDQLFKNPGIVAAASVAQAFTRLNGKTIVLLGVAPDKFSLFFPSSYRVEDGSMYTSGENTMILGKGLSEELLLHQGDSVAINGQTFKITGVLGETGGFDNYFGFMSVSHAMAVSKADGYSEIWIQIRDQAHLSDVKNQIEQEYPFLVCNTKEEYLESSFSFVRMGKIVEWVMAFIGILIAAAAAMNTMLMSAYERMKEYGTLRTIGASRFFIFALVLLESVLLSLVGGIAGILSGVVASEALSQALVHLFQLAVPIASITFSLVLQAIGVAFLMGFLGAVVPAFIVSGMDVVKAIRWE